MLWRMIGLFFLLGGVSLAPGQENSSRMRISSQVSPLGTFELATYQSAQILENFTELHLEARQPGFQNQVLFRGGEATWALIAPDETWIVVNSAESDRKGLLYLFRRTPEGLYEEIRTEVERLALAALMKAGGHTAPPRFDAFFCYADFWSEESGCLLAHIDARERGAETNSRFYFVYDPAAQRVSLDLKDFNRGAFDASPKSEAASQ